MPMRSCSDRIRRIDLDLLEHAVPVAVVLGQALVVHLPAEGAQVALDGDLVIVGLRPSLSAGQERRPQFVRHQVQRLLVHGALVPGAAVALPGEGEEHALVGARVLLQALLEQAGDGALGAADRAVQEQHAALGAVALGGRLEGVDQVHQRPVEAVDGVAVLGGELGEELVAGDLLLVLVHLFGAVREDHVVQPLVGGARHLGVLAHDVQVFVEGAFPVLLAIVTEVQLLADGVEDRLTCGHRCHLQKAARRRRRKSVGM